MEQVKTNVIWNRLPVMLAAALFCCALWGSATPSVKIAYELFHIAEDDAASRIMLSGARFMIAGAMTIVFGSLMYRRILIPKAASIPRIICLSMFQTIGQYYFFFMALAHLSGVRSVIINAAGNFLTILAAALVFRLERLNFRKIAGCVVGFAGILVILGGFRALLEGGAISMEGEGAMLLSAVFVAGSGCLIKIFSKYENPVALSGYQFLFGGAVLFLIGCGMGGQLVFYTSSCIYNLIYMGFISAGAYTVWSILLKYNPVSRIAILGFMTPVMGILLSAVFLHEENEAFSLRGLAAILLVSAGIVIVNARKSEQS